MKRQSLLTDLLALPPEEKIRRFDAMVSATYSHIDGRDLLNELHPRRTLDIKRRVDARETWFEGDWLSNVWNARDGKEQPRAQAGESGGNGGGR